MARGVPIERIVASWERLGHLGLVAADVGLKRSSVESRVKSHGMIPAKDSPAEEKAEYRRAWTPREDAYVRGTYPTLAAAMPGSVMMLAAELGRHHGALIKRAFRLGVTSAGDGSALLKALGARWSTAENLGGLPLDGLTGPHNHFGVLTVEIPGPPVPKARARQGAGGHTHTPQRVIDAEQRISAFIATIPIRYTENLAMGCFFALKDATQTDADNLEKLVLDAINDSGLWLDDAQVTASVKRLTIDRENPRTVITLQPYVDHSVPRGQAGWPTCMNCRERFKTTRKNVPRCCSEECEVDLSETEAMTLL